MAREILCGRGGWTWYTGSSSWYYKAGVEHILGLKIKRGYLSVEPCIPRDWNEYQIQYKWRDSVFNIKVKNPEHKNIGVSKVFLDGVKTNNSFRLSGEAKIYNIEVIM